MKINWSKLLKRIPVSVSLTKKIKYQITWLKDDPSLDHVGASYHNDDRFITIGMSLKPKEAVHTYLHELLHAVSDAYDVGLTEEQVQKLEQSISFIIKNGNVFKE